MRIVMAICAAVLIATGCSNDKPEPETKENVVPVNINAAVETVGTSSERTMTVRHHVRGNSIYIECIVNGFSFEANDRAEAGKGYLQLYIDGKKVKTINQAAFIIKNVSNGKHVIELELMKNKAESYGVSKQFTVVVQS